MKEKIVNVSILHSGGGNALMNKLIGKRNKVLCLCIALLLLTVGYLGGLATAKNSSYSATGSLISKNGVWYGGAENGVSCTVGWTGTYKITVSAGSCVDANNWGGGNASTVVVLANLVKGDVLRFNWASHGVCSYGWTCNWTTSNDKDHSRNERTDLLSGCDASMIYLNNTPLVGAGQNCIVANSKFGTGWGDNIPDACPLSNGQRHKHTGSGSICNVSNCWYTAPTISATPNFSPLPKPTISTCYLDTSRATLSEISMGTDRAVSFRVEAIQPTQSDSWDAQAQTATYLGKISTTLTTMTTEIGKISQNSGGGTSGLTDDVPTVTVNKGANFDVVLSVYDDMASGSSGTVQVVNSSVGDNIIHLKGKYTEKGVYKVTINSKKFVINVIENPSASNVTVKLE